MAAHSKYNQLVIFFFFVLSVITFSALTPLVGRQEEHLACKN